MRIETERLYLYPIGDEDMREIIEKEPEPEMKQAYSEMLQGCIDHPDQRAWYAIWLMELKGREGTIVGDFCFKGLGEDGAVEIGYGLRPGHCGRGYMTETLKTVSSWAASQPGVARVEAETDPLNRASQKVLKAAGYVRNGEFGEEGPRFVWKGDNT